MTRLLEEMTWDEVELLSGAGATVVVPVGTVEQHGLHLPLGTDTHIIYETLKRLPEEHNIVIAPPIWYAYCSPTDPKYAGHITVTPDILYVYLLHVCTGLVSSGFRCVMIVFDHWPNSEASKLVAQNIINASPHVRVAVVNLWVLVWDALAAFNDPGYHADSRETSLVSELRPDLLRPNGMMDDLPELSIGYDLWPKPSECRTRSGVRGLPSLMSRRRGTNLADTARTRLLTVISQLVAEDLTEDP